MNPRPLHRRRVLPHVCRFALSAALALPIAQLARAADGTWTADASGSWASTSTTNWLNGIVAEGADFTAYFNAVNISSNRTITLASPLTIGNLAFGDTSGSQTWTLSGAGVLTLSKTAGSPTITVDNSTATIGAALGGNQGLTKAGTGKLILSGNNSTTGGFTGAITVSAGTLDIQNTNSVGSSNISLASGAVLDSGSSSNGNSVTISGDISGAGKINKTSSASTLTLSGNNTHTGGTTLTDGRLILGSGTNNGLGTGTLTLTGGSLQSSDNASRTIANVFSMGSNAINFGAVQGSSTGLGDLTFTYAATTIALGGSKTWTVTNATTVSFANAWSGANSVTKAGTGTLLFNGVSSYTGATRVNGGVLGVNSLANGGVNSGIGAATSAATNLVLAGGTLRFTGATSGSTNRLFSLAYGANGASSVLDSSGSVPMQFTATGDIGVANGNASTSYSSSIPVGTTTFTLSDVSNVAVGMGVTGTILPAGTYVTAVNTVTKQITLSQSSTAAVTNGTAAFTLFGGPRVLTLSGTNTGANVLAANLTDATPGNGSQAGLLSHAASLVKDGTGTWSLTGAHTYTGTTTINAGTLALGANNVFADTSNFVLTGGTLAVGSFNDSVGTLSLTGNASITLGEGGVFTFLDSHLIDWGTNTLSISGTFVDGVSIRFGSDGTGLTAEQLALISINGVAASLNSSGFLVASAIPEPSTYAMVAGGAILGLALMRRRR
ncbi:MAG TPA: autotransporter-associated beta strand repeat-containing protein [Rariglobus sp.]